jgi:hypothetical protein
MCDTGVPSSVPKLTIEVTDEPRPGSNALWDEVSLSAARLPLIHQRMGIIRKHADNIRFGKLLCSRRLRIYSDNRPLPGTLQRDLRDSFHKRGKLTAEETGKCGV